MTPRRRSLHAPRGRIGCIGRPGRQRGVVLLFSLIILVILLAGGVAVVRSMNASLSSAGNLAFKRDLINQGERAVAQALAEFEGTGRLATVAARQAHDKAANYSAQTLDTNPQGVPLALLSDAEYAELGTQVIRNTAAQVDVRYLIDRLCNAPGATATLGPDDCVFPPSTDPGGGSSQEMASRLSPPPAILYRLSMRVDGPRGTQVFLQSSFSRPE